MIIHAPAKQPPLRQESAGSTPGCLVVMYHYVHDRDPLARPGPAGSQPGLHALSIADFRAQLDTLSATMEPIDWPTYCGWLSGRAPIPPRSFLLTFDDGLRDHAEIVLPILEERGLRGVFFIPTTVLTTRRMLPAHQIHLLLSALGEAALENELLSRLAERKAHDWCKHFTRDAGSLQRSAHAMYHYEPPRIARLKYFLTMELPIELRAAVLDDIFAQHIGSGARWSGHWYLGWDDLAKMKSLGHTVGGHGNSHEPFSRLTADEVRRDIQETTKVLSEGLGPDPRPMSFPYGSYTDAACGFCRDAGFVNAFSTQSRWTQRGCDPFRLPRVDTIRVSELLHGDPICPRT